jgi:rhodanese-related sulfurtransferase
MATRVSREEVRRLQGEGALVVEVLPRAEYQWRHIAGSVNVPLRELARTADGWQRDRVIVAYCNDFQ